jgi:uncharacterized membrane protein YdjX (TVP38/TMEM64 family)
LSITAVRFRDYALASWLGMLPALVLYVYTGSLAKGRAGPSGGLTPSWASHSLLALGFVATLALALLIARSATRILRERLAAESPRPMTDGAE